MAIYCNKTKAGLILGLSQYQINLLIKKGELKPIKMDTTISNRKYFLEKNVLDLFYKQDLKKLERKTYYYNGNFYPIIYRRKNNELTDNCPYCNKRHSHGRAPGHRCAHCGYPPSIKLKIDDFEFNHFQHGYVIVEY